MRKRILNGTLLVAIISTLLTGCNTKEEIKNTQETISTEVETTVKNIETDSYEIVENTISTTENEIVEIKEVTTTEEFTTEAYNSNLFDLKDVSNLDNTTTKDEIEVCENTESIESTSTENSNSTPDSPNYETGHESKPGDCTCSFKKWGYVPNYFLDYTICVKGIHYMWQGETVLDPDNIECGTCGMVIPRGTLPQHLDEYHWDDENCIGNSVPHYITTGYYKELSN